jgi:hypothetical protein
MARVLYITSSARSGSTLTDLLAGSIPRALSTGEIKHLPHFLRNARDDSVERGNACSCLRCLRECAFWSEVIDRLGEAVGCDIWSDPDRFDLDLLSGHYHGRRRSLRRKIEPRGLYQHLIQHGRWRWLQRLWNPLYRRRVENNWLLFDMLAEVSGAEVVVDSSKDIRRLNLLCTARPRDVSVVLLMRSLPGCAHSAAKRNRHPGRYARSWVRHNNRIHRLLCQLPNVPVLPMQYERLVADPVAARRRIAEFLNLPDGGDHIDIDTRRRHLIRGNRLRYAGRLEIRPRPTWQGQVDDKLMRRFRRAARRLRPGLLAMGLDPFATVPGAASSQNAPAAAAPAGQSR